MILALDIGGTAVKLGLADREGRILEKGSADVAFDDYRTPVFDTVVSAARRFLKEWATAPEGIAVSATGQVDSDDGVIIGTNGKIPNYEGALLKEGLEEAFGVRTWALNDANAAVLGECFTGRARGLKNVVMVTLGTGVGGGVVAGFDPYEKKLLGITAMTALMGKKKFEEVLGSYITKPQGKPALVPESDKRPAINTAYEDFSEN